ncbi:MAG: glycyl-radical enzyme activating protein [Promethearchaeota archaeon]|nr:MAG: glycyl-radical enzyme activating protein [Candidatus Lokiarchaeota archaeon]
MNTPYIVDIKDNSLDDGVGIRSVVFFKGCPLKCVWCQNPEAQNSNQELIFEPDKCINCTPSCYVKCPNDAFNYDLMNIDRKKCNFSWDCVKSCPAEVFSIAGKQYNIEDLVNRFVSNMVFYQNSNGGVTLSGGEPMLFPEYSLNLTLELRKKRINVAIETCGLFTTNPFSLQVLENIQYLYFDVKFIDENDHKRYCGVENTLILRNFKELIDNDLIILPSQKKDLQFPTEKPFLIPRIPLIPGIVTTSKNLKDIAEFMREYNVKVIDLLPYNPLWVKKAGTIGYKLNYNRETWMSSEEKAASAEFFNKFEFDTFTI